MRKQLKARSPGKLILSGEHSVLYGQPAIALAVDRYAYSTVISTLSKAILFNCLNLQYARSLTRQTLSLLKEQIQDQYRSFLAGECGIRDVIRKPFELLQFTVTHLLESLNVNLSQGMEIRSSSTIPMGCGMGSSAAVVMSTLFALAQFLGLDIDPMRCLTLGKEAENLQHGISSGLDIQLAMHGGCIRFQEGGIENRPQVPFPLQIVNTGSPEVTTGECVSFVRPIFQTSSIAQDFGSVTNAFDIALKEQNQSQLKDCVRANHQLLTRIGVVPEKVQSFIREVELRGGSAKVCGGGAITGNAAGIVLVFLEEGLANLTRDFGYRLETIQGDQSGTCLV